MLKIPYLISLLGLCLLYIKSAEANIGLHIDYPGPYCARTRSRCCTNRQDGCSVPISTVLCYCDEFCQRGESGDCCPDYESFCLGRTPPAENINCYHNGKYMTPLDPPVQDNCNSCSCTKNGTMSCSIKLCLTDDHLISNLQRMASNIGWQAKNYSEYWGRDYAEGLSLRLGTFEPKHEVKVMSRISNNIESLPRHFDSSTEWNGIEMTEVKDQKWCGSSWAVSTAAIASDRYRIQSKGREFVDIAPQQFISCTKRGQQACNGGHVDRAWNYFRRVGLVDEECFPYEATGRPKCKVSRRNADLRSVGCTLPTRIDRVDLYKMSPAYALNNETDIMVEIMKHGPVQATLRVYRDFFSYSGGIYRRSALTGDERSGFHSVRLVGWGEERVGYSTVKYWIAINSWGTWWGENGRFRIVRGSNECDIENYVLAAHPVLHEKLKKSRHNIKRRN